MRVLCFTSFTFSYLNRARVLFQSLRRHHPDWHLVALMTDRIPAGLTLNIADEPFDEVVWQDDLGIDNLAGWLFQHDIVEVCTAVKGPFIAQATRRNFDAVIYLDPDTCLFNPLTPLLDKLQTSDIVLTPHLLEPEEARAAIIDNEICPLWAGIYNLGFVAIRTTGEGARFADWWARRLLEFCHDDRDKGLFVDQKWCDHVPVFFDKVHILKDPGYNTASWNVSQRRIAIDGDGNVRANDVLLRFWHFTKLGPLGDTMTRRYARDQIVVYELWRWYREQVAKATSPAIPDRYWAFANFENGEPIKRSHRLLYRERKDLQAHFANPFSPDFAAWLKAEGLA
ncbi:MAG: hypothetical protein KGQ52_07765 [Alphaproteobacteria bacterium]|nr:hypothetical protein [Alphaproteobacteria bacterium]